MRYIIFIIIASVSILCEAYTFSDAVNAKIFPIKPREFTADEMNLNGSPTYFKIYNTIEVSSWGKKTIEKDRLLQRCDFDNKGNLTEIREIYNNGDRDVYKFFHEGDRIAKIEYSGCSIIYNRESNDKLRIEKKKDSYLLQLIEFKITNDMVGIIYYPYEESVAFGLQINKNARYLNVKYNEHTYASNFDTELISLITRFELNEWPFGGGVSENYIYKINSSNRSLQIDDKLFYYDDHNNIIKIDELKRSNGLWTVYRTEATYEYEYDEYGNWISKKRKVGNYEELIIREIGYFDNLSSEQKEEELRSIAQEREVVERQTETIQDYNHEKKVHTAVEKPAEFPGGQAAMMKYLSQNIRYPKSAKENKIEGRVVVKFIVNTDGSISEAQVVKSVSPELDKEALRVVQSMPRWQPGINEGVPVRSHFNLPVTFRVPNE